MAEFGSTFFALQRQREALKEAAKREEQARIKNMIDLLDVLHKFKPKTEEEDLRELIKTMFMGGFAPKEELISRAFRKYGEIQNELTPETQEIKKPKEQLPVSFLSQKQTSLSLSEPKKQIVQLPSLRNLEIETKKGKRPPLFSLTPAEERKEREAQEKMLTVDIGIQRFPSKDPRKLSIDTGTGWYVVVAPTSVFFQRNPDKAGIGSQADLTKRDTEEINKWLKYVENIAEREQQKEQFLLKHQLDRDRFLFDMDFRNTLLAFKQNELQLKKAQSLVRQKKETDPLVRNQIQFLQKQFTNTQNLLTKSTDPAMQEALTLLMEDIKQQLANLGVSVPGYIGVSGDTTDSFWKRMLEFLGFTQKRKVQVFPGKVLTEIPTDIPPIIPPPGVQKVTPKNQETQTKTKIKGKLIKKQEKEKKQQGQKKETKQKETKGPTDLKRILLDLGLQL